MPRICLHSVPAVVSVGHVADDEEVGIESPHPPGFLRCLERPTDWNFSLGSYSSVGLKNLEEFVPKFVVLTPSEQWRTRDVGWGVLVFGERDHLEGHVAL